MLTAVLPKRTVAVQRLQTRPQFQAAMAGGTVARSAHFALHRLVLDAADAQSPAAHSAAQRLFSVPGVARPQTNAAPSLWMGALVPKRWARRAVTRSAIKRQIYRASADFAAQLPCAAHVVRLRAEFSRKLFVSASSEALKQAVRAELEQLFRQALVPAAQAHTVRGAPA